MPNALNASLNQYTYRWSSCSLAACISVIVHYTTETAAALYISEVHFTEYLLPEPSFAPTVTKDNSGNIPTSWLADMPTVSRPKLEASAKMREAAVTVCYTSVVYADTCSYA